MNAQKLRAIPMQVRKPNAKGMTPLKFAGIVALSFSGSLALILMAAHGDFNSSTSSTAPASTTPTPQKLVGQTTVDNGQTLNWYDFEISDTWAERVENEVRENLRDPDSARFTHIRSAISARGMIAVCGIVNSKNGFGGYSGNEFFIAFLSDGKVHDLQLDEDMAGIVTVTCGQMGNAR